MKSFVSIQRYPLSLFILALLIFFPALGARDFWAPVEPRYAEIARVMFIKGEWIVPTVNGDLYTDKPILYFWLVLIFSKLIGEVNEWTVRLPAALGALGAVLATFKLGKDFFSPKVGFIAGVVLATSARVMWEGRWAHVDMLFTFLFTLSMVFAARAVLGKGRPNEVHLAYVLMGLATLTKGLIGVVLPALILLGFVVVRRDWRLLREARLPSGVLIFLLVTAPWFVLVTRATGGIWFRDFIYLHHIQRYTAGLGHRAPFYYYFTTLPLDFMPWSLFAALALFAYRWKRRWLDDPTALFFTLWFVAVWLFFSVSDTKRELYLLPLFPPLALLVGIYIDDLVAGRLAQGSLQRYLLLFVFGFLAVGCLTLPIAAWFIEPDAVSVILPYALVMAAGGLGVAYFAGQRSPEKIFVSLSLMMVFGLLAAATWFLPFLNRYKSPRPFAMEVKTRIAAKVPLYIYADTMNDYNFYTERDIIPVISSPVELRELLAQNQAGALAIKERDLKRSGVIFAEKILFKEGAMGRSWTLISLDGPPGP